MQWIRRQFRSFFKLSNRPSDNQNVDKIHIPSSGVVADAVPAVGSFFVPISFSSTIVAIVASNIFQNNTIVSIPVYCVSPALHHPLHLSFELFSFHYLLPSPRSPIPKTTKMRTTTFVALSPPLPALPPLPATPSPSPSHNTPSISPSHPVVLFP